MPFFQLGNRVKGTRSQDDIVALADGTVLQVGTSAAGDVFGWQAYEVDGTSIGGFHTVNTRGIPGLPFSLDVKAAPDGGFRIMARAAPRDARPSAAFIGSRARDVYSGDSLKNWVDAEGGNDFVRLNAGTDRGHGGNGHDTIRGGDGRGGDRSKATRSGDPRSASTVSRSMATASTVSRRSTPTETAFWYWETGWRRF